MTDRKALVTGGCGFIGSRLCERLVERGYEVRATDLETADISTLDGVDVEFVPANLTRREGLEEVVEDVDVVFHTAAVFTYSSLVDWDVFHRVNVEGTRNLCDAAVEAGVGSMVQWSTSGVYGPPEEELLPVTEDHPKNPESNYDRSKWLQEQVAMEYDGVDGMSVKAIRPGSVYGPGNTYALGEILLAIARGNLRFYPLHCDERFSIVHVDDVVRAAIHLDGEGEGGEPYNVVDDGDYTVRRFVKDVAAMAGHHVYGLPVGCGAFRRLAKLRPLVPPLERLFDAFGQEPPIEADTLYYLKGHYDIGNEKLKSTGFELEYPTFREGMPETLEWYEEEDLV